VAYVKLLKLASTGQIKQLGGALEIAGEVDLSALPMEV
jgi:hypothetical protein